MSNINKFCKRADQKLSDIDYTHKLSNEEKDWYTKFSKEYYGAYFDKENNLHNTQELKNDCYQRSYERRCDVTRGRKPVSDKKIRNTSYTEYDYKGDEE